MQKEGLLKINGWDISECNARLWSITIGHCSIENQSEWISRSISPVLLDNLTEFKSVKIKILVKGNDRNEILQNRSLLISKFLEPVRIETPWFSHLFCGTMSKHSEKEDSKNRFHTVEIEMEAYEFSKEQVTTFENAKSMTVTNPGNLRTPVILEIVPIQGIGNLTISGLTQDPIEILQTTQGKKIVINAMTAEITEDGEDKAQDVQIWELPYLLPGENTLTLNYAADITIRFEPRFM